MRTSGLVAMIVGVAAVSATAAGPTSASASENGLFGGPIGGSDIRSAYLPPFSGLYGAGVVLGTEGDSYRNQFGDYSKTSNPAGLNAVNEGGGLLYVYPFKPLGITLGTTFQAAYQELCQRLTVPHVGELKGCNSGFADSYMDFLFASKYIGLVGAVPPVHPIPHYHLPYGLTVAAAISGELPVGRYTPGEFATEGKNTFITIPNVAITYLTGPGLSLGSGTEFSARCYYEISDTDPTTRYQGGNIFDIDWAFTQRFGRLQAGIAGAYASQDTPDQLKGVIVAPDGNLYEKFIMGPVIAYDSRELHTTFKLKATFGVHNENTYLLNTVVLTAAFKIF